MFASGVWLECFKIVFLCHFALSFAFVFGFFIFSVFRFFDFFGFCFGFIVVVG